MAQNHGPVDGRLLLRLLDAGVQTGVVAQSEGVDGAVVALVFASLELVAESVDRLQEAAGDLGADAGEVDGTVGEERICYVNISVEMTIDYYWNFVQFVLSRLRWLVVHTDRHILI